MMVALMAIPTAAATPTWGAYGAYEPDSAMDSTGFLWYEPPGLHTDRVYFNGFLNKDDADVNPNSAVTGSRLDQYGYYAQAVLGVWADCNQDGYVGLADSALVEYPSVALTQTDVCPDGGPFNHDGWVSELRPLSAGQFEGQNDREIIDPTMKVWADEGVSYVDTFEGGVRCATYPWGPGLRTTGGFLDYVDCNSGYSGGSAFTAAMIAAGNPDGLALADPTNWNEPGHPLNVRTLGDDKPSDNAVVLDCEQHSMLMPPAQAVADTWHATVPNVTVNDPVSGKPTTLVSPDDGKLAPESVGSLEPLRPVKGVNTAATPAGIANGAYDLESCGVFSNDWMLGGDVYNPLNSTVASTVARAKTQPDHPMTYASGSRVKYLGCPLLRPGTIEGQPRPGVDPCTMGLGLVTDFSELGVFRIDGPWSGSGLGEPRDKSSVARGDPAELHRHYMTYYADYNLPYKSPGATGVYGSAQCPVRGPGAPITNNWECDWTKWYVDESGASIPAAFPRGTVGDAYVARDVDCYDGQIAAGTPVYAGPGAFGPTCDEPYP